MNKRVEKMVKNYKEGKIRVRRDQLKKAIEENSFDYMIVKGYDEIYDVEPVKTIASVDNIPDYWFRGATIWSKVENNILEVTMCYGYSYKTLYVSLEEKKEEVEEVSTVESVEGIKVDFNEDKNGIEITFASKDLATEEIRIALKNVGFKYYFKLNKWIAKQNENTISLVNELFGATKEEIKEVEEVETIEVIEEVQETKVKPFTVEEMEITNNIVNKVLEMEWTLNSIYIDKNDNCIYGNITNKNNKNEIVGLYAPSDDLHELDGVYRCLNSKIVNTVLIEGMEEIQGTLIEEKELLIHIEGEGCIDPITTNSIIEATENLNARLLNEYNKTCEGYSKTFITLTIDNKDYKFRYDLSSHMNLATNIIKFMLDNEYKEYKYTLENINKFKWINEEDYRKEYQEIFNVLSDLLEEHEEEIELINNPYSVAVEKIQDNLIYEVPASHDWLVNDIRLIKNAYCNDVTVATGKAIKEFIREFKAINPFNLQVLKIDLNAFKEGLKKVDNGLIISLIPTKQDRELMKIKMFDRLEKELARV